MFSYPSVPSFEVPVKLNLGKVTTLPKKPRRQWATESRECQAKFENLGGRPAPLRLQTLQLRWSLWKKATMSMSADV
jgi:hypothetical protein